MFQLKGRQLGKLEREKKDQECIKQNYYRVIGSLCNLIWSGTYYVDQAGLRLIKLHLP